MSEPPDSQGADTDRSGATRLRQIGGFEIIRRIGQGGMGTVFQARQTSLDRIVALKVLPPSVAKNAAFIERFQREARASAKLNHPNIVQGIDVGRDEATGLWYFAMEYVDGPSLLQILREEKVLPEERALKIAREIAEALECAAHHNIVHRDVKPDNILMTAQGEAKLADLGLAKQISSQDPSVTQSGQSVGTPFYMAPEQVRGEADQLDIRTDLYALGGTLYHLVTGQPPYTGENAASIMAKHLAEPPPRANRTNPEVSEATSRLIFRMMQKKREQRFQTPRDVIQQIERILRREESAEQRPVGGKAGVSRRPSESDEKPASRLTLIFAAAAVVVVLGIALGVVLSRGDSTTHPDSRPAKPAPHAAAVTPPVTPKPSPAVTPIAPPPTPKPQEPAPPPTPPVEPTAPTPAPAETPATPPATPTPPPADPVTTTPAPPEKAAPATKAETKAAPAVVPVAPAPRAAYPWPEILAAVHENAPQKAAERVRGGEYPAKDVMLDALSRLEAQREARQTAIKALIGQTLKVDSTKGPQNGKLVAFKNGTLQLEQVFIINGESRGATQVYVAMDELTPATLDRIAPLPAPATPAEWLAAALLALAGGQLDAAEAALGHVTADELRDPLMAEIKQTRVREREAQARAAWAKLEARASEPPSQTRAKQLLEELAAFSKKFGDSDFGTLPETVAKMQEMKERFDRLSLGLDPRVVKLFKGRVLNYDAKTQVITLGYDFLTKEQTDDFVDSTWAPPGDHTGLTWRKGELRTFCKGTADRILKMPQFVSSTLTLTFDYKKYEGTRARFEVEISFHGLDSTGKTPKTSFHASDKGVFFLANGAPLKSNPDEILLKKEGTLELSCQGQALTAKLNGKAILEHTMAKPNDHTGFWLGGGWDSGITFTKMQVSGRLDPVWLTKALEAVPKPK
jgi:serine/threonine protein kinase